MILWHFTRREEFSKGLMCLSIEWKLYTCRNSNQEQLRKIYHLIRSLVVRAVHRHCTGVGSIPAGRPYSCNTDKACKIWAMLFLSKE